MRWSARRRTPPTTSSIPPRSPAPRSWRWAAVRRGSWALRSSGIGSPRSRRRSGRTGGPCRCPTTCGLTWTPSSLTLPTWPATAGAACSPPGSSCPSSSPTARRGHTWISPGRPTTPAPRGATPARAALGCRCAPWSLFSLTSPNGAEKLLLLLALAEDALAGCVVPHPLWVTDLGYVVNGDPEPHTPPPDALRSFYPAPGPLAVVCNQHHGGLGDRRARLDERLHSAV